jgi:hypothetical protein
MAQHAVAGTAAIGDVDVNDSLNPSRAGKGVPPQCLGERRIGPDDGVERRCKLGGRFPAPTCTDFAGTDQLIAASFAKYERADGALVATVGNIASAIEPSRLAAGRQCLAFTRLSMPAG